MGDLLNGVPRSSKETRVIVFCPFEHLSSLPFLYLLSGFVVLSGLAFLSKLTSSGFVVLSGLAFLSKLVCQF